MKPVIRNNTYMMVDKVKLTDIQLPSERPTPSHYWDGAAWAFDKTKLIDEIKSKASDIILAKYPEWKQINMQSDSTYANHAISGLLGITVDAAMLRAVSVIGLTDDIETLKGFEDSITVDGVQTALNGLTIPEEYVDLIKEYFVSIIKSTIAYRLIRLVRVWSNTKEQEILDAVDVSTVSLTDYPLI